MMRKALIALVGLALSLVLYDNLAKNIRPD
jgi:hypothetical protein